jgi:CubicO group peptidase (beta-lactamase class C family)
MGKSMIAALFGILVKQGDYDLPQPAPIPECQAPDDPRAKIRIADLLRMSSGLRIKAAQDPDYDPSLCYMALRISPTAVSRAAMVALRRVPGDVPARDFSPLMRVKAQPRSAEATRRLGNEADAG